MSFSIERMLNYALDSGASDLHLSTGSIPMVRIHGVMKKLQLPKLELSYMEAIKFNSNLVKFILTLKKF